jgi:hypothetical protein
MTEYRQWQIQDFLKEEAVGGNGTQRGGGRDLS